MCIAYVIGGLCLIALNYQNIPEMIYMILHDAFNGTAAIGGFVGVTVSKAISSGLSRSINSNEAGQGSSPLVHGSANTIHPIRQGLWGSFEVFVDTIIICSVTALAILCTGTWTSGKTGATLTILAFQSGFGTWGPILIGLICMLFGLTTTSAWFTYYVTVINYILRFKPILRDKIIQAFKCIFPLTNVIIVSYIVLTGHSADLFWTIVSITLVVPVFTNLLALFCLRKKFWALLEDYKARYMGIGIVDPNFYVFYEDDPEIAREEEAIREQIRQVAKKVCPR